MKSFKDKLLDVLLFPVSFYEKLTDSRLTLYLGILLIGAVDLMVPNVGEVVRELFYGKPSVDVYYNIFITVLLIAVLGAIDVFFTGVPLFDFFNFLKKKENKALFDTEIPQVKQLEGKGPSVASRIKVMKVYIASHFLTIPVSTIAYYLFFRYLTEDSPAWAVNMYLGFYMLVFIWSTAITARGCNRLFRFSPMLSKVTYIFIFAWNYIFGLVFNMQIMNWLLKLYR